MLQRISIHSSVIKRWNQVTCSVSWSNTSWLCYFGLFKELRWLTKSDLCSCFKSQKWYEKLCIIFTNFWRSGRFSVQESTCLKRYVCIKGNHAHQALRVWEARGDHIHPETRFFLHFGFTILKLEVSKLNLESEWYQELLKSSYTKFSINLLKFENLIGHLGFSILNL